MHKNIIITLIISLFINKLKATKCIIGTETNIAGSDDDRGDRANCVNCKANYYFSGANFISGVSQCFQCPSQKTVDAQANAGRIATLAIQCNTDCPTGTQTEQGILLMYYKEKNVIFVRLTIISKIIQCFFHQVLANVINVQYKKLLVLKQLQDLMQNQPYNVTLLALPEQQYKLDKLVMYYLNMNVLIAMLTFILIQLDLFQVQMNVNLVQQKKRFYSNKRFRCFYGCWIAGTDICIPCTNIVAQGSEANCPISATQSNQCKTAGTFSQFLIFSLLSIYLYLL
ncbi:immobilization antigen isoform, putative [Ichthyophthirius multifiliis]|uniref:Immobilization antigen isoform, putative n=1 Tax=Ichthyophthirius multifiliis TaxID=5932 RepID=G0QT87_ICHMU|nr:immobilization antigen isoform, putative [Ichthyophthirius multifiliis]EGR31571.1 immobilization antigen isoform, putative [Ichthyophthirius multifiliis]|eukprot:XP_004035057.1 immobilization antigen isoform, putative [Ichthyophthirius multifiliis]